MECSLTARSHQLPPTSEIQLAFREDEQKINSHRRPESQENAPRPEAALSLTPVNFGALLYLDGAYMTSILGTMAQDEGLESIDE